MFKKFYSAKYDRAFKEVFLKEKNKDLLKDLLEKVLDVKISNIKLLPTQKLSGNVHIAEKTLDALLDTNVGKIGIEVNSEVKDYIRPRNMSYICNDYASHTLVGESYDEETMIMQINFTYGMPKSEKEITREYTIRDNKGKMFVENFKIIEINMEYYLNLWYSYVQEGTNKNLIEKNYLLIMLGLNNEELKELSKTCLKVNKYMEEINEVNEDPRFVRYMTHEEDLRKINNSIKKELEKEKEEISKEKDNLSKEKDNLSKEKKELDAKIKSNSIEIAKNMLKKNMSLEDISEITNLSIEEIEKNVEEK